MVRDLNLLRLGQWGWVLVLKRRKENSKLRIKEIVEDIIKNKIWTGERITNLNSKIEEEEIKKLVEEFLYC